MSRPFALSDPGSWGTYAIPVLLAIIVLALGYQLSRLAQREATRWMPRIGDGNLRTVAPLAGQAARYMILIFAFITALGFVGVPTASIIAVISAASLALALSLQNTLSNVASGIMLTWIKPVALGEYITGDGVEGVVVEIGLFGTRLRSASGLFVFTNNNKLWNGAITNHSREPRRRVDVNVTLPDTVNVNRARSALLQLATDNKTVLPDPAPAVIVASFGTDTVSLVLRAWVPTPDYREELRNLTEAAKDTMNDLLSQGAGGTADVTEAKDPHLVQTARGGGSTSDEIGGSDGATAE
jgi:small conductance mechanosensitive channel